MTTNERWALSANTKKINTTGKFNQSYFHIGHNLKVAAINFAAKRRYCSWHVRVRLLPSKIVIGD